MAGGGAGGTTCSCAAACGRSDDYVMADSDQIGQGKYVMAHRLRDAERESSRRAGRRRHRTESVAGVREAEWGQKRGGGAEDAADSNDDDADG